MCGFQKHNDGKGMSCAAWNQLESALWFSPGWRKSSFFYPEASSPSITTPGRLALRQVRHSVVGHLEGEAFADRRKIVGFAGFSTMGGNPPKNRWKLPFGLRNAPSEIPVAISGPVGLGPNLGSRRLCDSCGPGWPGIMAAHSRSRVGPFRLMGAHARGAFASKKCDSVQACTSRYRDGGHIP